MLALVDPRSGTPIALARRPGDLIRVCVSLLTTHGDLTPGDLRALVVADGVRRVLEELHDQQVMVVIVAPGVTPPTLHRQLDPLWIPDPMGIVDSIGAVAAVAGGQPDLVVISSGADEAGEGVPQLPVGQVDGWVTPGDATDLRLFLLSWHHTQSLRLGPAELDVATATLRRWRHRVADWADERSAPMPPEVVARAYAACDNNLDIPAILGLLHQVEQDTAIPDGAKFEIFVHLDRVLAVNLAAFLGSRPA